MAEEDPVGTPSPSKRSPVVGALIRGTTLVLLGLLIGFIVLETRSLWGEWHDLQGQWFQIRHTAVVGYENITTRPSYADKPEDWIHDEGDFTLLWSGWKPGSGHGWFRVGRGEVDRSRFSEPMGRDVIQAIDRPIVEVGGGTRWERIPYDAQVVGLDLAGVPSAYPLVLLDKVEVVNDKVEGRAVLVLRAPLVPDEESVNIYDTLLDGRRLTMGLSGYLRDGKPVLYDRSTESLWTSEGDGLAAFAGRMKGTTLARISHPIPVAWQDWRCQHPRGRLIVGADRSPSAPTQ